MPRPQDLEKAKVTEGLIGPKRDTIAKLPSDNPYSKLNEQLEYGKVYNASTAQQISDTIKKNPVPPKFPRTESQTPKNKFVKQTDIGGTLKRRRTRKTRKHRNKKNKNKKTRLR
jgi:hypothetical protein